MLEDINANYLNNGTGATSAKNTFLMKKVNSFRLSFEPNETKKLTISYKIPAQRKDYYLET
jgi:hypothetical protein